MAISRRKARILALKALFEIDSVGHNPQETLQRVLEGPTGSEESQLFVTKLVQGVLSHQGSLDETIQAAAPHWPLEQMAGVDKNILRLAIFEILFDNEVPLKVAINEAVELAKIFGGESSPRFVNGVLGTIAPQKINSGEGGREIWQQCSSE